MRKKHVACCSALIAQSTMLSLKFARRYLISKKSTNAINIISAVSVLGMLVGSAGLILVLSVFNGFEEKVEQLYNNFYPELIIQPSKGKTIDVDSVFLKKINSIDGIKNISETIEDKVLLTTDNAQSPAMVKGVDENYTKLNNIGAYMYSGTYELKNGINDYAVLGVAVLQRLNINIDAPLGQNNVTINYPRKQGGNSGIMLDDFTSMSLPVKGSFAIQQDFDDKYVLVPLEVAQQLFESENKISSYEISVVKGKNISSIKKELQKFAGEKLIVKDRFEQNEVLYKVMRTEKWAVYAILTFILIVAAFNIIGSLSMLVIEKKKDIKILKTMGAGKNLIRNIFLTEGIMLSVVGCLVGFFIATTLCIIQIKYGVIKIQGDSFAFREYPVKLQWQDFVLVFFTVLSIGILASLLPAIRAARTDNLVHEE